MNHSFTFDPQTSFLKKMLVFFLHFKLWHHGVKKAIKMQDTTALEHTFHHLQKIILLHMARWNPPNPDIQTFSVSCCTSPSSFLLLPVWAPATGAFWGDFLPFNFSSSSAGISLPSFSSLTYKYSKKKNNLIIISFKHPCTYH